MVMPINAVKHTKSLKIIFVKGKFKTFCLKVDSMIEDFKSLLLFDLF